MVFGKEGRKVSKHYLSTYCVPGALQAYMLWTYMVTATVLLVWEH